VAGLAIEAVEFKVFVELGEADEALEGSLAHLGDIFELHVVGDEGFDLVGVVVGEAEAAANVIRHADTDIDVAIETNAVAGFRGRAEGGRFANIVEKNAPGERGRDANWETVKHEEGVEPDVAFGMELRRLSDTFHGGDFGEKFGQEAEFIEKFEGSAGGAFGEELGEFLADAFRGNNMDCSRVHSDGGEGFRLDGVVEACSETHGAEHPEFVFGETPRRFADGADDSGGEIGAAAHKVEDFAGVMAHQEAVDGEIAALDIFFGCFRVDDLIGMAAVRVAEVGAEGGDFDLEGIVADEDDAELRADIEAVGEELQNFGRSCVGGDVVIRGIASKQDVAHTAADEESLVTLALERVTDRIGEFPGIHGMIMRLWGEVNEVEGALEV